MSELFGVAFFLIFAVAVWLGLRAAAKRKKRTEEEFERGAAESASLLGAGINALHGMLDPSEKKGKDAVVEMKRDGSRRKSSADEDADRTAAVPD